MLKGMRAEPAGLEMTKTREAKMTKPEKAGDILAAIFMTAAIIAMAGMAGWQALFAMPCRVERDCRGQGVEAGALRSWEETGNMEMLGLADLAGWRVEPWQTVSSVSTRRQQRSQVIAVYGAMELVMDTRTLSGCCGMDGEGDGEEYCVLSQGLAGHLFGSVDVAGECVRTETGRYIVAGVVEYEGDVLMVPTKEGAMDHIAVLFQSRAGAEEKMGRVMEGVGVCGTGDAGGF